MQPGEVWLVDYAATGGREQAGPRPGLVLQDDGYARGSPAVVTVPFTTSAGATRYPAVLFVRAAPGNGLTFDSYLMVFQVAAADRRRVVRKLGDVSPAVLAAVYDALDRLTGRPPRPATPTAPPPGGPP